MNNIIFLDFDGVLCTERASIAVGEMGVTGYLDPVGIKFIERLITRFDCKLVISSTWRKDYDVVGMYGLFKAVGSMIMADAMFIGEKELWRTPQLHTKRGYEIEKWLSDNSHRVKKYLIIDDDTDMLDYQMDCFVQTDAENGILFDHYMKMQKVLAENEDEIET